MQEEHGVPRGQPSSHGRFPRDTHVGVSNTGTEASAEGDGPGAAAEQDNGGDNTSSESDARVNNEVGELLLAIVARARQQEGRFSSQADRAPTALRSLLQPCSTPVSPERARR